MPYSTNIFTCIIVIHRWNGWADSIETDAYNENEKILSIAEYRKLMDDYKTTDERIQERIAYLVRFTQKNIKTELQKLWQK